jgi:hypothetical protein
MSFVLVCLILPLISAIDIPLDLVWLQGNCMNLVAAAGTMATLSLAFLFERIEAVPPPLGIKPLAMRILAIVSIFYFLFASFFGLMYQVSASNVGFIQTLFWYTFFGIFCLIVIGFILFLSQRDEVIL